MPHLSCLLYLSIYLLGLGSASSQVRSCDDSEPLPVELTGAVLHSAVLEASPTAT